MPKNPTLQLKYQSAPSLRRQRQQLTVEGVRNVVIVILGPGGPVFRVGEENTGV